MIKGILSISGKPGLFKLLSRGKNALIVENIATKKRIPTYAHEKVISLADITMYTEHGDEPLPEILDKVYAFNEGKAIDLKSFPNDAAIRECFGKIIPDFDTERVYTTDIRKLFSWYNQLVAAGFTEFKEAETADEAAEEAAPEAEA
ncbi:MAG: DUF5606 domain-containing protein [Bacteroidales bacterium]|nr:DUF5606 domain-containing protein [Bacteroidales bacterium]